MTQTQQNCSTPDQLLTFLRGQLSSREESELQLHLNDCVLCRERLDDAAADANAWNEAKLFFGNGALHASSEDSTSGHEETTQGSQRIRQVLEALGPTDDPESLGRIGGYEVTGVVGAGGMGVVLKAHDRSLDRIVAIKVMSPHLASSGSARKRFAREAKAAAAVLHPNVIAIHGVASEDGSPYLVMPYVRGASLQKRIDSQGPLPLKDTLRIGAQIAAGLAAAHEQGLVHRDIKPANILLEEGVERVTITDFGLARAVDDASMTCSGVIAGTPQYMSPEQTRGEPIDARSDLFSLGSVLYAMCAGRPPFRAETTYGVLHRIANDSPTPVCEVNSDVPAWLGRIIKRLMAKRRDDRFESAGQVAELLEGCLAHVQQSAAIPLPAIVEQLSQLLPATRIVTNSPMKQLGQLFFTRPPFVKFIVAAAFAFSLVFAGILIVLELNKGTLTIESESEDVPIRIMQGDKVVEKMTVTKSPQNVRIAAGNYVVEVDGDFRGVTIKDGNVSLTRRGTATVEISRNAKLVLTSRLRPGNLDGLRFGERHERDEGMDTRGYWNPEVAEPGEILEIFASFPTLGNGIEEVGLIVSVEPPHKPTEQSKMQNYLVRANSIRRIKSYSACEASAEGKEFFRPDDASYTVGYLRLQLEEGVQESLTIAMIAGSARVNITYAVGLPNEQVRKQLKLDPSNKHSESWLSANVQMRPQSAWASHLMKLDGWEKDSTRGVPNIVQREVTLTPGETQTVSIEPANDRIASLASLSTLHFNTPEVLMKHAAECQTNGDVPGFMACWTDQPFKDLVPSYVLTSLMQLQHFENAPSGHKPSYPEELAELKQILTEEFGDQEAGRSLLALAMAHKEIADRSDDKFAEAAEATANSPLVQLLASGATNLINPRSFITRLAALHEKYQEPDEKREPKVFAYTIEQVGDKAIATETTGKNKFGLIKTGAGWQIDDLWYGLKPQDESASAAPKASESATAISDPNDSYSAADANAKIVVDLYCGKDVLGQMNTTGSNKAKHVKLSQDLNAIEGVQVNFREAGAGNEIASVIVRDPGGLLNQEARTTGKPSARRNAISRALERIPSVRWEEGGQTSVPPLDGKSPEANDTNRRFSNLRFSESREVVLSMGTLQCMLDLDTGQTCPAPAGISDDLNKFDVRPTQDQPYEEPRGLTFPILNTTSSTFDALSVEPDLWNIPDSEVFSALATAKLSHVHEIPLRVGSPNTYLFRTAQKSTGLLQVIGTERIQGEVNEPWGIRIRYKILRSVDFERATNSVNRVFQYLSAVQKNDMETIKSIAKGISGSDKFTREISALLMDQGIPKLSKTWFDNHSAVVALGPFSSSDQRVDGRFLLFSLNLKDERWSIIQIDLQSQMAILDRFKTLQSNRMTAVRETQNPIPAQSKLLTTWEEVEARVASIVKERQSIVNTDVDFRLESNGKHASKRRYHVWLNNLNRRSDCRGVSSDGTQDYTTIVTPTFDWFDDHKDKSKSQFNRRDPQDPVGWGTLGCIVDIRKIGLVNWSIESIDTHDFDEDLLPKDRTEVYVETGDNEGRPITIVKLQRKTAGVAESWTEYWLSPMHGNYPIYIANGWTDSDGKYVVSQHAQWKFIDGIWFPTSVKHRYQCEQLKISDSGNFELVAARFNVSPFPNVFDPLEDTTEHRNPIEARMLDDVTSVNGTATADEAYQAMEKLLANPKMDRKSTDRYIAVVATRMTSNIEFAKYVLDHFRGVCIGGEPTYQARRHLLAVLTRVFHAWGQSRWSKDTASPQQHFKSSETWPQEIRDFELSALESVVGYGRKATRSDIVDFVRAARALHHPDSQQFLRDVLLNSQTPNPGPFAAPVNVPTTSNQNIWSDNLGGTWPDARFVAAVGLAELGDQTAIEWLIATAKPNDFGLDESVDQSRHLRDRSGSLRESSRCALADLFGQAENSTESQLSDWWKLNRSQVTPRAVRLKSDIGID